MTDVFISYSRKDTAFVQRLFSALEAQGHDAWVDWDDIEYAEDWWRKIQAGIEGADTFVFIISPSSARSKVCFDEVQHAESNHKRIVPVVIEDVTDSADSERMHPALKRQNWLFFRSGDDFDTMLADLLETLRREPEYVQMHTRLLVNAHEWEAGQHDASLTLRGEALQRAEQWLAQAEGKSPTPSELQRVYIAASRKAEQGRRQRSGLIGGGVLLVLIVIALLAFTLFQQTQRDQQVQASLAQADLASTPFADGALFDALALAVEANTQLSDPPEKSLNLLREIAGAPGPIALFRSDSAVTSVAFSPDRRRVVAAYADGSLKLWDATQGVGAYDRPLYATSGEMLHAESITSVVMGPQGRYVVSGGCFARDPDSNCLRPEINLWEIVDDQLIRRHHFTNADDDPDVSGAVNAMAINPQQSETNALAVYAVFSGARTAPVRLRYYFDELAQIQDLQIDQKASSPSTPLTAISVSLDNEVIAGNFQGSLSYYQSNEEPLYSRPDDGRVNALAFSPSASYSVGGRPFLIGFEGGLLQVSTRNTRQQSWQQGSPVNSVAYSPDGMTGLAAVEGGWLVLIEDIEDASRAFDTALAAGRSLYFRCFRCVVRRRREPCQ